MESCVREHHEDGISKDTSSQSSPTIFFRSDGRGDNSGRAVRNLLRQPRLHDTHTTRERVGRRGRLKLIGSDLLTRARMPSVDHRHVLHSLAKAVCFAN